MDLVSGSERVDRNNIPDLRIGLDSEIELIDKYYLLVINMSTEPIEFTVSGPKELPKPEPEPEVVDPVVDDDDEKVDGPEETDTETSGTGTEEEKSETEQQEGGSA